MKAMLTGQVLRVRVGTTKAGKAYAFADVYDGEELVKVFGVDPNLLPGTEMTFPVSIRIGEKGDFLVSVIQVTK